MVDFIILNAIYQSLISSDHSNFKNKYLFLLIKDVLQILNSNQHKKKWQ